MATAFEVLYDLAIDLQTNPFLKKLTFHHNSDRGLVEARLQRGILESLMPGEAVHTQWGKVRIFCRNYVNRAQPVVTNDQMNSLLQSAESLFLHDGERIDQIAAIAASTFSGKRKNELVFALEKFTSKKKIDCLANLTYLEWIEDRWFYWSNKRIEDLDAEELLKDLQVLYLNAETKISGMGLPLAANFFADMGLTAFAKPDLHVTPVANMLTLQTGVIEAFEAVVKIVKIERQKLDRNLRFSWLNEQGGLCPRHLDRLIYMIGSDNFLLNSHQSKRYAPQRRKLMRDALISGDFVSATYC